MSNDPVKVMQAECRAYARVAKKREADMREQAATIRRLNADNIALNKRIIKLESKLPIF